MSRRGFSLLEVLVALGLIIALLGAIFTFLGDLLRTRAVALEGAARQRASAVLIDRIEAELFTCLVGDQRFGAGVKGDEQTLSVLSRSVAAGIAERGAHDAAVFGDLQQSHYRFDPATGIVQMVHGPVELGHEGNPKPQPLAGPLGQVRFRYHDGRRWRGRFDSLSANQLPVAVEVAIWFDDPRAAALGADKESQAAPLPAPDFGGGFDERAFALESDAQTDEGPRPDRIRVIVVPDGPQAGRSAAPPEPPL